VTSGTAQAPSATDAPWLHITWGNDVSAVAHYLMDLRRSREFAEAEWRDLERRLVEHWEAAPPELDDVAAALQQILAMTHFATVIREWHPEKTESLLELAGRADSLRPGRDWPFQALDSHTMVRRLRLSSPLDALLALPSTFVAGGGAVTALLVMAERLWNFRVRVARDREKLQAETAEYLARRTDAELKVIDTYTRVLRDLGPDKLIVTQAELFLTSEDEPPALDLED
jgi:hypothetical protein